MNDSDNALVAPHSDTTINVADIWLEAHAGIVLILQESRGLITLSNAAMDGLCRSWLRHRIGVEEPAA